MRLDKETKNQIATLYNRGAGMFIFGFLIWNIDNIFCDLLSGWKFAVNWPAAFLLEGMSCYIASVIVSSHLCQVIHGGMCSLLSIINRRIRLKRH